MSGYDDQYWSEVNTDESPLERAREDADLREWEAELERDRLIRHAPTGDSPKGAPA